MSESKLDGQIALAKSLGEQAVGMLLREIGKKSRQAAEMIEQDLENAEMSIGRCYAALEAHARKHQQKGCWACPVIGIDPENEVVKLVLEFYHVPADWLKEKKADSGAPRQGLDLMALL